jgi:hypothetical protein
MKTPDQTEPTKQFFLCWLDARKGEISRFVADGEIEPPNINMTYCSAEKAEIEYTSRVPSLGETLRVVQKVELFNVNKEVKDERGEVPELPVVQEGGRGQGEVYPTAGTDGERSPQCQSGDLPVAQSQGPEVRDLAVEFKSTVFTNEELERRLNAVKYPNGPEDKAVIQEGLSWDFVQTVTHRTDWALACKLANALVHVGDICEKAVERMTFYKFNDEAKDEEIRWLREQLEKVREKKS